MVKPWPTIEGTLDRGHVWEECGTLKGYKRMNFAKEMVEYCHKKTRIAQIHKNNDGVNVYALEGCEDWWWAEEWFYDMSYKNILPDDAFRI